MTRDEKESLYVKRFLEGMCSHGGFKFTCVIPLRDKQMASDILSVNGYVALFDIVIPNNEFITLVAIINPGAN